MEESIQFGVVDSLSANKFKRKLERKLNRYEKLFENEKFVTTRNSSETILVCNAGLVNGVAREVIVELFSSFGSLKHVLMVEGKSHCFVQFHSVDCAEKAVHAVQGRITLPQTNGTLYLLYCDKLPESSNDHNKMPPGLILLPEFISDEEETCFSKYMTPTSDTALKHRQVSHYGFEFRYGTNDVDVDHPLETAVPEEFHVLFDRLKERGLLDEHLPYPEQLTINQYLPGQGIPPHVDTHSPFGDVIVSLSLVSDVVMEFRDTNDNHLPVLLPRKSVLLLTQDSRYGWTHGITPRKLDVIQTDAGVTVRPRQLRLSCTFRWIKPVRECDCRFDTLCDIKINHALASQDPSSVERKHVHEVYDAIADHFSDTRHSPWPRVVSFLNSVSDGSLLVDVGCGNGKYFSPTNPNYQIGCDRNSKLASICQGRGFQTLCCDCLYLPFRDSCADAVISIAVVHHLSTPDRRLLAIREIVRILKVNGQALIYVWAKDQCRDKKSNYLRQGSKHKEFDRADVFVPYTDAHNAQTHMRYYHVFEDNELREMCEAMSELRVEEYYYDDGNWCVRFRRIS
uniref:tRNA (carboxymethyluridine(34)-5-O)-methyltransferase n=1 Tax=Cacopsylla melanoneura TaxID=428564 RepID=A0A8D8PX82_9HEMI